MKTTRIFTLASLLVVFGLLISSAGVNPVAAQGAEPASPASLQIASQKLTWLVDQPYRQARLVITAADGTRLERSFASGAAIELPMSAVSLADGGYRYELTLLLVPPPSLVSGSFSVQGGTFAPPIQEGGNQIQDVVHPDDVIITGGTCLGYDCHSDGSEDFSVDLFKLKVNMISVLFEDTSSTPGIPSNDWRILINDRLTGGTNYFAIQDATSGAVPLKIAAAARENALFISNTGKVGLGTNNPVMNLNIVWGDTPSIRLDQDNSSGWTPQVWDIGGNEGHFFIRDTSAGSKMPFRIQPGTPTNTITLKADGKVGIGTWSPLATLHVVGNIFAEGNVGIGTAAPTEKLQVAGNIRVDGYVIEYSDINAKENFASVDGAAVLEKIAALPISSWNYKQETDSVRHIGPMAQDFFAAFGLGSDDRHIAALDTNGVSLAAIQELIKRNTSQQAQIDALQKQNAALEARLERLEKTVRGLQP
jgi:hypothetical protein